MKVTSKVGDKGRTKFRGSMLNKSSPIFELLGGLDEIQAAIGIAYEIDKVHNLYLTDILRDIYVVISDIYLNRVPIDLERSIDVMEFAIAKITEEYSDKFNKFILPVGSPYIAQLNYARTIVRKVERFFIGHTEEIEINVFIKNELLIYLNRLSDFLYTLATSLQD